MASKYGITEADLRMPGGAAYEGKLQGKIIGFEFSASWCPPCRQFSPVLSQWYREHKNDTFEIIFVSSDRDVKSYEEFANHMTFPALKYEDRKLKEKLAMAFGIQGIPTLVIVDADGTIITKKGREGVMASPDHFPWRPKGLREIITAGPLLGPKGAKIETNAVEDALKGKNVAIYFSASWCGPCKKFSPVLAQCYESLKAKGQFEVIFVSADRDQASFDSYFAHMPWLAIPFGDARLHELNDFFEVEGIPTILMVDGTTFQVRSRDIRPDVMEDPTGAKFPWKPEPVVELNAKFMSHVNDVASLVVFCGPSSLADVQNACGEVAARLLKEAEDKGEDCRLRFAAVTAESELSETLRQFLTLGPRKAEDELVLIHIRGQCKYVVTQTRISKEFVEKMVQNFLDDRLEGKRKIRE